MALIKCPECGRNVSDKASACPNCGCPVEAMEINNTNVAPTVKSTNHKISTNNKKYLYLTLIIIAVFLISAALIGFIGVSQPSDTNISELGIEPFLAYIGEYIPAGETISLEEELYNKLDNAYFLGMVGKISFKAHHEHVCSCSWISSGKYSEDDYNKLVKKLEKYFGAEPRKELYGYDGGDPYEYYWIDPHNGHSVQLVYGGAVQDIGIMWEVNESSVDFLDHDWVPATSTQPKTCRMCGQTEGEPLSVDIDSVIRNAETHATHGRTDDIEEIIDEYYNIMTTEEKKEILGLLGISKSLDAVENEIIPNLKSPRSYHRYSFDIPSLPIYSEEDDEYFIMLDLKYGATNSYGAEITNTITATYRFTIDLEEAKAYTSDVSIWDF